MLILIEIKKLVNFAYDDFISNNVIKFKMYVIIEHDTESESNYMLIDIAINEKRLRIMTNWNASESFITTRYAHYYELFIQRKNVIYRLLKANDTTVNDE